MKIKTQLATSRPLSRAPHSKRYRQIVSVFARHGIGSLLAYLKLEHHISLPTRFLKPDTISKLTPAEHLRLTLEELGPTFIVENDMVYVPKVYWNCITRWVLVMERIQAIKVDDMAALAATGYDREKMAINATNIMFKEVIQDGFFHADSHAGNYLIMPGEIIGMLDFGLVDELVYERVEAPATPEQKAMLEKLSPEQVKIKDLAGEKIQAILTKAPGNDAPIGGLKVIAQSGWFTARPSGTENIYKIYAESFKGVEQLHRILDEAQTIISDTLAASS